MVKDDRVFLLSSTTADSTDGKAAADSWCTSRNFTSAGEFQIQNWPTAYPVLTLTADDGTECQDTCTDMKCKCSSYKFVECFRGAEGAGCGKTFKDNSGVDNNGSGNFGVTNIGNYNNGRLMIGFRTTHLSPPPCHHHLTSSPILSPFSFLSYRFNQCG